MARLVLVRNPLDLTNYREEVDLLPGQTPIAWLLEHYPPPNGCGAPLRYFVNGRELDLDDLDLVPEPDDHIALVAAPQGIETIILTAVITAVVSAALSMAIGLIFKKATSPAFATSTNENGQRQPSTVYDVRAQQNTPRLGEPIPVIYGQVLTTPDYAMQPHAWFDAANEMWLDSLLVIGQGDYSINEILLGDTHVDLLTPGVFSWAAVPPAQHRQQMGNLGFFSNFYENVVSCPEVGGQEFTAGGDSAGMFRLSKTGLRGRYLTYDLEWPAGLYRQNTWGGGGITATTIEWVFIVRDLDNNVQREFPMFEGRFFDNDPVRMTYGVDMGYVGAFAVAIARLTGKDSQTVDRFKWTGAKLYAEYSPGPVYGDVTLLAVRIKASAGIGDGQQVIRVRCTRRIPVLGSGAPIGTRNAADAFVDIYCNQVYGARRPLTEVDIAKLAQLHNLWSGYAFDAVYTGAVTVWQALSQAVQGMAAAPLPMGSYMSIAQDGIKPARSMLFSEQNIVRDSFGLNYDFDKVGANDGVEIEYRETANFSPAYVRVPYYSVDPERIVLFGCSDPNHATEYAQLIWNRRLIQRQTVEFETELEGLIPFPGERIAVSHTLPDWGLSGYVAEWDASTHTVTVDREIPWSETYPPWVMSFRTQEGGIASIVNASPGPMPNQVVLSSWPLRPDGAPLFFSVGDRQENTHWVFGTASTFVRDFILNEITPRGGWQVAISGLVYNPSVFQGAMRFLGGPVP